MTHPDVAVIGLGAMGSAALYALAARGVRAVGFEQFAPGHDRGSSHGETRMIRLGYYEHPSYVPLLRQAYEGWRDLETATGRQLLTVTGIAEIGPENGTVVAGTLAASRRHGLAHEVLDAAAAMKRLPFRLPPDYLTVVQPDAGFLAVESAIDGLIGLARAKGAEIRSRCAVTDIRPAGGRVALSIDGGVVEAGAAIVTAGPWLPRLIPALPMTLHVTREVFGWYVPPDPAALAPGRFPVFLLESRHGIHYGFPLDANGLIKFAKHHHRAEIADPDRPMRPVGPDDEALMRSAIAEHLPSADGPLVKAKTCLYTSTPDFDFLIDAHPDSAHIIIGSPCSGHGFKFAPILGEILADLALSGSTRHDIARFRFRHQGSET